MHDWERPGASVIAVTTPNCPNCRAMKPLVESAASEFEGRVALVTLDAAADPALAGELGVRGVPTYIARSGGSEVMRRVGRMNRSELDGLFVSAIEGTGTSSRISAGDRRLRLGVAAAFAVAGIVTATPALFVLAGAVSVFGIWDLVVDR